MKSYVPKGGNTATAASQSNTREAWKTPANTCVFRLRQLHAPCSISTKHPTLINKVLPVAPAANRTSEAYVAPTTRRGFVLYETKQVRADTLQDLAPAK